MSWKCPECNKELKTMGSHMSTHVSPDFLLAEEDIIDDGKIAVKLTVEPMETEEIKFTFNDDPLEEVICVCIEDSINVDCETHKWLRDCTYCNASGVIVVDDSMPSVVDYRCAICGRIYTVNTVEKVVAWKVS